MKKLNSILLFTILLLSSCGGEKGTSDQPKKPDDNPDESLWKSDLYLPLEVSVFSNNELVEAYTIGLDKTNRVESLVRRDNILSKDLLNLKYSYSGISDLSVEGIFFFSSTAKTVNATIDKEKGTLKYKGEWDNAWAFEASYDDNGTVLSTTSSLEFSPSTGQYSCSGSYHERYTVTDGNITVAAIGTEMTSQSSKLTESSNATEITVEYTYSDKPDNQNFGLFLMNCDFPIWLAKGLPGNRNLITGMKMKHGNITLPESFTVEYTFDDNGDILTATRTDYNETTAVLKRVYKLSY